jgi:hypothetical protein
VGKRRCLAVSADVGAVGIAAGVGVGVESIVGVGLVESISRVDLAESWPTVSAPIPNILSIGKVIEDRIDCICIFVVDQVESKRKRRMALA